METLQQIKAWFSLPRQAIVVGILMMFVIYPDVIFYGATVSNYGQFFGHSHGLKHTELYPERLGRLQYHGISDAGGGSLAIRTDATFYGMGHLEWGIAVLE